jgi:hypothetical protein
MRERNVSTKLSPVWLFKVSANDVHQLIRPFARIVPIFRFQHVMAQMSFHELCHQAVHASSSSSDQLQYFGAIGPFLQGSFDGGHLPPYSLHPDSQFGLVFCGVPHADILYPGGYIGSARKTAILVFMGNQPTFLVVTEMVISGISINLPYDQR